MAQAKGALRERFEEWAGRPARVFSAPGRVNLIGEHTDYNDGYVLPMALDRRTYVAAAPRADGVIRCRSTGYVGEVRFELNPDSQPARDWANVIRGVATCLLREEYRLTGADLLIESEVPIGAGLSSSAALEVATGLALLRLADEPVDPVDLALVSQRAEQQFAGTNCGIMDQYIAALGVEGHALLIDCRSLEYRAVPLNLSETRVVICNSMVQHELASGEYNQRRAECEEGRAPALVLPAGDPRAAGCRDRGVRSLQWVSAADHCPALQSRADGERADARDGRRARSGAAGEGRAVDERLAREPPGGLRGELSGAGPAGRDCAELPGGLRSAHDRRRLWRLDSAAGPGRGGRAAARDDD